MGDLRSASFSREPSKHTQGPVYSTDSLIAEGSFGAVFLGTVIDTHESVAIKRIKVDPKVVNRELIILKSVFHPNVVRLKDAFYTSGWQPEELNLNLVMEYVPETLERVAKHFTNRKKQMPLFFVKLYTYQLFRGLGYLHINGICHRDVKPANLLVDPCSHRLAIGDLGSAKHISPEDTSVSYIGARYYRAPELLFGAMRYTEAVDLWSAGCVLAELLLGQPLFKGQTSLEQLVEIVKVLGTPSRAQVTAMNPIQGEFRFPALQKKPWSIVMRPENPTDALDLISKLLIYEPEERLTAFQALGHDFFSDLREQGAHLPNGRELPPLFDWLDEEVDGMPDDLFRDLTPD